MGCGVIDKVNFSAVVAVSGVCEIERRRKV
jgi:hypothetical protein